PEKLYERHWAITILEGTLARIRLDFTKAGKVKHFDSFEPFLTGEAVEVSYNQIASDLGMSEGAVKVAVHRLRRRFGQLLRIEIAKTVARADQIDAEMKHLFSALGS